MAEAGESAVTLDELAKPFSRHVCEHLKIEDRQGTSGRSRFLDVCRKFNQGQLDQNGLLEATAHHGFENVIDAFHVVNRGETLVRFFRDERKTGNSIALTDELFRLRDNGQYANLPHEVEAAAFRSSSRWR